MHERWSRRAHAPHAMVTFCPSDAVASVVREATLSGPVAHAMAFRRLLLRVGVPFVLLVLTALLVLTFTLSQMIDIGDRNAFEELAAQNALFVDRSSLELSPRLAEDLRRVTGVRVFVRRQASIEPTPAPDLPLEPLLELVADGRAVEFGEHEAAGVAVDGKGDLLFVRSARRAVLGTPVLAVLGFSLLLTILAAWLVVRGLVGPLRNLARHLPNIESSGALELPEAQRPDEIGELARAFLRTRTALREAQESRQRIEKFALLGRMTASLAHEVQNPIAAIRFHAQLWHDDASHPSARTIEHEAARIESMLNQWMYLTRPEPPAMTEVDVGALLVKIIDMHRSQAQHAAVEVTLDVAPNLIAMSDGRRLEQVFRNILTNAVQAMPGGGVLRIVAQHEDGGLCIGFHDSGRGFSATALAKFGEFFFSEREGGMGIGLSVAQEIVRAHGGNLTATNQNGGGAVVTVWLPTHAAEAARP